MKITTFNINGVRARHDRLIAWIDKVDPDVLCLQETKCRVDVFPLDEISKRYPYIELIGQPSFNGVAICSKQKMFDVKLNPVVGEQQRSIAVTINGIRIVNVYIPQGQSLDSPKYTEKLNWLEQFDQWFYSDKKKYRYKRYVLLGDFNIAPTDLDVWSTKHWTTETVSCTPLERAWYFNFLKKYLLTDAVRSLTNKPSYTWWSYRGYFKEPGKYGVRLDHVLISPGLTVTAFHIDEVERKQHQGASDHTALTVTIK